MKQSTPTCPARTAVAYARYSSAGQRDVSIEQQLADIRAYAAREGYHIVREYADHARSGYKNVENRAAFQQMLSSADSGTFDTVLCWKVDRFGRSREDSAVYKGRLRRFGVKVLYVMEPIPDGSAGILLEGMLEATAEWYSVNLSENVKRGLNDNAARCLYNGAHVYGYVPGPDKKYQIVPERAAVVRQIYSLYLSGESLSRIVRILNDSGLRNATGKPWNISLVYHVLTQERYTGVYIWKDQRTPGGIPAIIDQKTWEDVQRMLKRSVRKHSSNNVEFLLTGKAFCGHCGKPMVGDSGTSKLGTPHYYYSCQSKKRRAGCDKKSVRKQELEDAVIDFIFDHCLTGEEMDRIATAVIAAQQESMSASPLAQMERQLADVDRKIDNINNAIAEGIWNSTTKQKLDELSSTHDSLVVSISNLRATFGRLLDRKNVLAFLRRMASQDRTDPAQRKFLIQTFVNAVYVFDDHLKLYLNAIEGASQIPVSCSDVVSDSLPTKPYPNPAIICYIIAKREP